MTRLIQFLSSLLSFLLSIIKFLTLMNYLLIVYKSFTFGTTALATSAIIELITGIILSS